MAARYLYGTVQNLHGIPAFIQQEFCMRKIVRLFCMLVLLRGLNSKRLTDALNQYLRSMRKRRHLNDAQISAL